MTRLAFIGFGEVGQTFAKGLSGKDGVAVGAYDLKFDDAGVRGGMIARAEALGVRVAADAADAAREARVVISAVTAAAAGEVAAAAARYLKPGQIFLDINSASPNTKRTAAGNVAVSGADYVEGAVMAAVAGPGLKVHILAGSAAAQAAADLLNPLGLNLTPVATEIGRASRGSPSPATIAIATVSRWMRDGVTSSPSITNSPIWASQPMPSANDRVALRCGSSELPSTSAAT